MMRQQSPATRRSSATYASPTGAPGHPPGSARFACCLCANRTCPCLHACRQALTHTAHRCSVKSEPAGVGAHVVLLKLRAHTNVIAGGVDAAGHAAAAVRQNGTGLALVHIDAVAERGVPRPPRMTSIIVWMVRCAMGGSAVSVRGSSMDLEKQLACVAGERVGRSRRHPRFTRDTNWQRAAAAT